MNLFDEVTMEVNKEGYELQCKVYLALHDVLSDYVNRGFKLYEISQAVTEEVNNWKNRAIFDREFSKHYERKLKEAA